MTVEYKGHTFVKSYSKMDTTDKLVEHTLPSLHGKGKTPSMPQFLDITTFLHFANSSIPPIVYMEYLREKIGPRTASHPLDNSHLKN